MFWWISRFLQPLNPMTGKTIQKVSYYSRAKISVKEGIFYSYPLCMDCKYYIPMEHSPLFPNSACQYGGKLIPCTKARSNTQLCGIEGKHFKSRFHDSDN